MTPSTDFASREAVGLPAAVPEQRVRDAKEMILRELGAHGAVCLSRFSMEVDVVLETLATAAEQLVEQGLIRPVEGLRQTYELA